MSPSIRPYPRVVVTDLDGTLLDPSHNVTRRSAEALALAQKQPYPRRTCTSSTSGDQQEDKDRQLPSTKIADQLVPSKQQQHIQVMIASGRSPRSVQKVLDQLYGLLIPDAVLCLNGSLTYNPVTRAVSFPQFIPHHALVRAVRAIRQHIVQDEDEEEAQHHLGALNPAVDKDDKTMRPTTGAGAAAAAGTAMPRNERPGFACEVIWDDQPLGDNHQHQHHNSEQVDPTTFVCDRVWEAHRSHTIYYDHMTVDCMQTFVESLRTGPRKGRVLKMLVLDRTRTAGEVYDSLPPSILGRRDNDQETATTTTQEQVTVHSSSSDLNVDLDLDQHDKPLSELLAITYSGPAFIEITRVGVHKGLGLQSYCQGHGINRHDVVAFGDWLNDYEMLTFAGHGCVMGNGHPDLKKLAMGTSTATAEGTSGSGGVLHEVDGVTNIIRVIGSNAEDGLAAEIESWFS
ncbi:hypothetical protein BGZ73_003011 [Actinomortierella ambigua]|nr:hypothetical protein BGZ73_003011 [Actinomortierella ambigua]